VVLNIFSDEYSIAAKHIVPPQSLLPLIRLKPKSVEELVASNLVSVQLEEKGLLELFEFLNGSRGLTLENGKRVKLRPAAQG
jgi:hypothetical protein